MTQELLSTSAPAGLHPGSSGFCTVMQSRDLPQPTAELLETLSGYRPVFLPGDPREAENPPALSHVRLSSRGRTVSVISRVAAAGRDYTNRSNRVAHHVVLDGGDARPVGGPAWLATAPGFLDREWDGQVRWLPAGRPVPSGDSSGGFPTWQRLTGDAGWAAALADAMIKGKTFYLVYDLGMDVAALIAEALSRVPAERRWDVTFTTYFTGMPAGVRCDIRAVLRGTAEERAAPGAAKLDVASLRGRTSPPLEVSAAPLTRVPARVASPPVPTVTEPAAAPLYQPEGVPAVEVEQQLREEFGLKRARPPKSGGGVGLLALATLSLVVVVGSGVGAWILFADGKKPGEHAGVKDVGGKEPPKDVGVKDGSTNGESKDATKVVGMGPKDTGTTVQRPRFPVLPYPKEVPVMVDKIAFTFQGPMGDVWEGEWLTLTLVGGQNFKEWDLLKVEGVSGAMVREGKVKLPGLKPGDHRITLVAGKTADRYWDGTAHTIKVKEKDRLTLVAVTKPDPRKTINGLVECKVIAKRGDVQVKDHEVQLFAGDIPLGKPGRLGAREPTYLMANLEPGEYKVEVRLKPTDPRKASADALDLGPVEVSKDRLEVITVPIEVNLRTGTFESRKVEFKEKWGKLRYPIRFNNTKGPITFVRWEEGGVAAKRLAAAGVPIKSDADGLLRAIKEDKETLFWVEYVERQQFLARPVTARLKSWITEDPKRARKAFEEVGKAVVPLPKSTNLKETGLMVVFQVTIKDDPPPEDKK